LLAEGFRLAGPSLLADKLSLTRGVTRAYHLGDG
jgi:hypothetical protein